MNKDKKNVLYEMRIRKKMTQKDVADATGTTANQISRLENGDRELTPKWLERLSKALNCSKGELLGEEGISEEEREILDMYKQLSADQKNVIKSPFFPPRESKNYSCHLRSKFLFWNRDNRRDKP